MDKGLIARTIIEQLGGKRFIIMTGATSFMDFGTGVRFNIGRNSSRANVVRITLLPSDTYRMQFMYVPKTVNPYVLMLKYMNRGLSDEQIEAKVQEAVKKNEPKVLQEYDDVYCDQLQDIFTRYTGLYTRL